jgi:cytochrome c peroxidase
MRCLSLSLMLLFACHASAADGFQVPKGLPPLRVPADNPLTPAKVALGKQLYFDNRLSIDNTVSCATCHDPKEGWADSDPVSSGVGKAKGGRNAPSVVNAAYFKLQFWDGRANELEGQALGPIQNPVEMSMKLEEVVERLNKIEGYRQQFQKVFGTNVTEENIARAIAAFERTVLAGDAPYDRFKAGDKAALSDSAQRGLKLFNGKANCSACHSGPLFSDAAFHNIGVGMNAKDPDLGRYVLTKLSGDRGAFRTPPLRDIARTAPYMHNGSMKTLEDVVDWYNKGGHANPQLDEEIFELNLSDQEKMDLVTFLKEGLTSDSYPDMQAPELPK